MFSNSDRIRLDLISVDKFGPTKIKYFILGQPPQRNTVNADYSQDETGPLAGRSGYSADGVGGLYRDFQTGTLMGSCPPEKLLWLDKCPALFHLSHQC